MIKIPDKIWKPSGATQAGQKNLKNKKPPTAVCHCSLNFLFTAFFNSLHNSLISLLLLFIIIIINQ